MSRCKNTFNRLPLLYYQSLPKELFIILIFIHYVFKTFDMPNKWGQSVPKFDLPHVAVYQLAYIISMVRFV